MAVGPTHSSPAASQDVMSGKQEPEVGPGHNPGTALWGAGPSPRTRRLVEGHWQDTGALCPHQARPAPVAWESRKAVLLV